MGTPNRWDDAKSKILAFLLDGQDHTFPEVMAEVAEVIPEDFAVRNQERSSGRNQVREVPLDYKVWAGRRVLLCRWLGELRQKGWVFCDDAPLDQRTVRLTKQGLKDAEIVSRRTLPLMKAKEMLAKSNGAPTKAE